MNFKIPELSLVVLIGASGSGKSTFARQHFKSTEVISSDFCRGLVSDDENDQSATKAAFDVLRYIAAKRLETGRLTVIDATNVQVEARKPLIELAREYHMLPVAIVLDMPEKQCVARNSQRPDRAFGDHVIRNQMTSLRKSIRHLDREGFRHIFTLSNADEVATTTITREPLWNNRKINHGPFDIIGDVHGCFDELRMLLTTLGYVIGDDFTVTAPTGRKAVFVGDLVDRGPAVPSVLRLVMNMVATGTAICVPGNHDVKLVKALKGKNDQVTHGLAESLEQLQTELPEFKAQVAQFLDELVSHYVFDDGNLVVAHAGLVESMQGRGSRRVREFALFGETTGETDEFGLPIRYNWASEYRGRAMVVYGHTPIPEPEWLNNTINIDTGCVFGGALTALRYPERELVSIPALLTYSVPAKPFLVIEDQAPALTAQQVHDDVLDLDDVLGKRLIETRLAGKVMIREENAAAALEVMSRYAINSRWLIYLPPTMSPSETSQQSGLLKHPTEAFDYFRVQGVPQVVCEEKHMGSRAVVVICRDETVARRRFGVVDEGIGACFTRTGRRFFNDAALESEMLARLNAATGAAGLWDELGTDWLCLDAELMPWSAKAQDLLRDQYAAVGSAATAALHLSVNTLQQAAAQNPELAELLARTQAREALTSQYIDAYRRYCWPINSLDDFKLAPFHILAGEKQVYINKDHVWRMDTIARMCAEDASLFQRTPYQVVNVTDPDSQQAGVAWWEALTGQGGEGMVIKPLDFVVKGKRGIVQPALKCRGPEYLRIIYGPEYTLPANLERLRSRGLSAKRTLAMREFALGVEGLERFVRHEPLRHVHECTFGVLALESEPVDPRL